LRPGGTLVLMDLLEASFPPFMRRLFPPQRTYDLKELERAVADAGFSRWRIRQHLGLVYRAVAVR